MGRAFVPRRFGIHALLRTGLARSLLGGLETADASNVPAEKVDIHFFYVGKEAPQLSVFHRRSLRIQLHIKE